ncbi:MULTISPECIES: hypothetical protein [Pseudomonas]|uniref:hypothetical protein n=1 Tax=Pseudomonas TaxID=286 RepID=UPI001BCE0AAA|nr:MULTISPECIES: hypothetical protein [Pseudomonas]UXY54678.1 hypothetical protein N9L84_08945 [Pseudomonas tohonis]BBP82156.1 hypothetical protein PHLH8_17980 [Pseudomonas sp. Pc102]
MTDSPSAIFSLLSSVGLLPLVVVWLLGCAMAARFWRAQPRAAGLCLASMLILLVWQGMTIGLHALIPILAFDIWPDAEPMYFYAAINLLGSLVHTLAFGLLIWAVFTGREGV